MVIYNFFVVILLPAFLGVAISLLKNDNEIDLPSIEKSNGKTRVYVGSLITYVVFMVSVSMIVEHTDRETIQMAIEIISISMK